MSQSSLSLSKNSSHIVLFHWSPQPIAGYSTPSRIPSLPWSCLKDFTFSRIMHIFSSNTHIKLYSIWLSIWIHILDEFVLTSVFVIMVILADHERSYCHSYCLVYHERSNNIQKKRVTSRKHKVESKIIRVTQAWPNFFWLGYGLWQFNPNLTRSVCRVYLCLPLWSVFSVSCGKLSSWY